MARRTLSGARAIVTGASSGIGRAIALELARLRAQLVLTARRADRLDEVAAAAQEAGGEAICVAGDITSDEIRGELLRASVAAYGGLDVLVNNAGVGATGPFRDADENRLRHVMEVNFFAPLALLRAALPLLEQGDRPIVVNIGSVLGHFAVPNKSEYCASKFALHGFSDALRAELRPAGIDVLLVSPSTTESEFFEHAGGGRSRKRKGAPAAAVARATVRAMLRGRQEIILTPGGKLAVWADRLAPALVNRLIGRFA